MVWQAWPELKEIDDIELNFVVTVVDSGGSTGR